MAECYICGRHGYFEYYIWGYWLCEEHNYQLEKIIIQFLKQHKEHKEVETAYG